MMLNGILSLGRGVSSLSDADASAQTNTAFGVIGMINSTAGCSGDWSKAWNEDAYQYFVDSLSVVEDQSYTAKAAADYAEYQEDIQSGQRELSVQDTILQTGKSVLRSLGNAMDAVYSLMQGPMSVQKATSRAILMLEA